MSNPQEIGSVAVTESSMHEDQGNVTCRTCGTTEGVRDDPGAEFIYALGQISAHFPTLAIEKEFAQATGRVATNGLSDGDATVKILSATSNRYLVRQLCWILSIEGLETYLLIPKDLEDLKLLVSSLRPRPRSTDIDVVIGIRGNVAPPSFCNGLTLPMVRIDQVYSFAIDDFMATIPVPNGAKPDEFEPQAEELLTRILQLADNSGATDEHRAVNYLALRDPSIYAETAKAFERGASLSGVEVRRSRLSGTRKIVDVIFSFTDRQTGVSDSKFARVDVEEEFPFLFSNLRPFYER